MIELAVVLVIISVLVAIALPSYVRVKDKAKEAESKASLHNIQLVLERFAVDNAGTYPPYLIGGDNRWMEVQIGKDDQVRHVYGETPLAQCSDPLLRSGYLSSYPRNPFSRNPLPVQQLQAAYGDPLRSSYPDGRSLGTRFGSRGEKMGQVLCDARWLSWQYNDLDKAQSIEKNTWANVQYEFYDVWQGARSRPFLPGSFMYKSVGEIVPPGTARRRAAQVLSAEGRTINLPGTKQGEKSDPAIYPVSLSGYMLGAWGGIRSKGDDLLGEEPLVIFAATSSLRQGFPPQPPAFSGTGRIGPLPTLSLPGRTDRADLMGVPSWTRSVNRSHVGPLWGSPYGPGRTGEEQLTQGNPNGMRDGVILWLSSGEE